MTAPSAIQINPLDPVFSGVPVTIEGGAVNPTWNKWFVDLREKVNVINAEVAALSGGTLKPVLEVHAGTNVTVDNTDTQNPIVSSTGGGGDPLAITFTSAVTYVIPLTAAPSSASNRGWIETQSGSANYIEMDVNANVPFPVGTDIFVSQGGNGTTTIKALAGVTFTGPTITGGGRYSIGRLTQLSIDNWRVTGDLQYQIYVDYASTILADTPVAYWHLGEVSGTAAADSSGNGYTGTYSGTYTQGQPSILPNGYGSSLLLSGGGAVITPSAAALSGISAPVSLELWLYFTTIPSGNEVLIELAYSGPQLAISSFTNGRLTFGYSGVANGTESTGAVAVTTKTHAVVTVTSTGAISYYINGAAAGTGTVALHSGSGTGKIGAYSLSGFSLSGSVQEVAVYNYVLTAAQVLSHYSAGA